MGLELKIIKEKDEINLTDFTIEDFVRKVEDIQGKNEYLARNINSLELFGKYSVFDESLESLEVNKLAQWAKVTAHEKSVYRKLELTLKDNNDEPYDSLAFEKAFVVEYSEDYDFKRGTIEFYVLIREFKDEILEADGKSVGIKSKPQVDEDEMAVSVLPLVEEEIEVEFADINSPLIRRLMNKEISLSKINKTIYLNFYTGNSTKKDYYFKATDAKEFNQNGKYSIADLESKGYKRKDEETNTNYLAGAINVIYRKDILKQLPSIVGASGIKTLTASNNFISFIKNYEGFSAVAEDPGDNTLTIGYGINLKNKSTGDYPNGKALYDEYINKTISKSEAEQLLKDVLNGKKGTSQYAYHINQFMESNKFQLSQHQFDALLDLAFNGGTGWITRKNGDGTYYFNSLQMLLDGKSSTSAFKREWIDISKATLNGVYGTSENLVERRLDEVDMFFSANYSRHDRTIPELNRILDTYNLPHVTV